MGKSPTITEHWILADSPKLDGSSPKLNGTIFGGTLESAERKKQKRKKNH